jgi:hypothetical protein
MSYQPDSKLIDWPDERRFSELVAQHRSGFAAGTQPQPAEACTDIGHDDKGANHASEWDWWTVIGTVVGAIAGYALSALYPNGFAPLP